MPPDGASPGWLRLRSRFTRLYYESLSIHLIGERGEVFNLSRKGWVGDRSLEEVELGGITRGYSSFKRAVEGQVQVKVSFIDSHRQ